MIDLINSNKEIIATTVPLTTLATNFRSNKKKKNPAWFRQPTRSKTEWTVYITANEAILITLWDKYTNTDGKSWKIKQI